MNNQMKNILAGVLVTAVFATLLTACGQVQEQGTSVEPAEIAFGTSKEDLTKVLDEWEKKHFEAGGVLYELVDSYQGTSVTSDSAIAYYTGEADALNRMIMSLELEDEEKAEKLYQKSYKNYSKKYTLITESSSVAGEEVEWTAAAFSEDNRSIEMILLGSTLVITSYDATNDEIMTLPYQFIDEQIERSKICGSWYSIQQIDNATGEVKEITTEKSTTVAFYQNGLVLFAGNNDTTMASYALQEQMNGADQFAINCGYVSSTESDLIFTLLYADRTPDTTALNVGAATLYLTRDSK